MRGREEKGHMLVSRRVVMWMYECFRPPWVSTQHVGLLHQGLVIWARSNEKQQLFSHGGSGFVLP